MFNLSHINAILKIKRAFKCNQRYTMKKHRARLFKIILSIFFIMQYMVPISAIDYYSLNVGYQAQVNSTWLDFAYGGALSGTEGGEALDSLEVHLVDSPYGTGIEYRVYTTSGWGDWASNYQSASNKGEDILGAQIRLKNFPQANVYYQSYRKGLGWGIWVSNGATTGQLNPDHPISGFRVKVDEIGVSYYSSSPNIKSVLRQNGETQGTGSLETLSINLNLPQLGQGIEYRVYLKSAGWTNWVSNGKILGYSGSIIEAIEAKLINLPQYSVQIQAQVEGEWWDYVYDGQQAGSIGSSLSAYRIKIVQKVKPIYTSTPQINENTNPLCTGIDEYEYRISFHLGTDDYAFEHIFMTNHSIDQDVYITKTSTDAYESFQLNLNTTGYNSGQERSAMHVMVLSFGNTTYYPLATDRFEYCFGSGFNFYLISDENRESKLDITSGSYYLLDALDASSNPLVSVSSETLVSNRTWLLYGLMDYLSDADFSELNDPEYFYNWTNILSGED